MKSALLGFLDAVKRYPGRFLAVPARCSPWLGWIFSCHGRCALHRRRWPQRKRPPGAGGGPCGFLLLLLLRTGLNFAKAVAWDRFGKSYIRRLTLSLQAGGRGRNYPQFAMVTLLRLAALAL